MRREYRTTCNRDCPDSCGVIATVEDGRVVEQRGDPEHGVTRGVLCARGNHYLERLYHPDRLLHPQRREGSGWRRISGDAALDEIADRMQRCRDESGPGSVLHVQHLIATKTLRMVNAQILPSDLLPEPVARLHTERLAAEGFGDGDLGWVLSRVGSVRVRLRADPALRRDAVLINPALWSGDGCGVNQLREAQLTDLGDGAALHETRVRLARARPIAARGIEGRPAEKAPGYLIRPPLLQSTEAFPCSGRHRMAHPPLSTSGLEPPPLKQLPPDVLSGRRGCSGGRTQVPAARAGAMYRARSARVGLVLSMTTGQARLEEQPLAAAGAEHVQVQPQVVVEEALLVEGRLAGRLDADDEDELHGAEVSRGRALQATARRRRRACRGSGACTRRPRSRAASRCHPLAR
jgi:hypothetical protein